jgi:multidrug efflux pump subunit AcrA (membrane-fusion protein)
MNDKIFQRIITIALAALFLASCGSVGAQAPAAAPTDVPIVAADTKVVSEGRLVPRESVQLSFFGAGQVLEVLVEEGDQIESGEVVARLGNREQIESTIANAQVELLAAQQALEKLSDDLPQSQTDALQTLNTARDALHNAERESRRFDFTAQQIDVEIARANVALAKKALDKAEKDYRPYRNKPENDLRRAAFLNKLAEAQDGYDDAVSWLNQLTGVITNDFELEQAQTELAIAQSQLELAQEKHELLKNGPDPDDMAAAEARISAAEAALASARAAFTNLDLVATISGTVVDLDLIIGQQITAGQPVITIADFSQMYVETDDLTEIDVVDVASGQKVLIVPDALPELELAGTVGSISDTSEVKRGEVTYTARIKLDEIDPRLRWGMTVAVTFEE